MSDTDGRAEGGSEGGPVKVDKNPERDVGMFTNLMNVHYGDSQHAGASWRAEQRRRRRGELVVEEAEEEGAGGVGRGQDRKQATELIVRQNAARRGRLGGKRMKDWRQRGGVGRRSSVGERERRWEMEGEGGKGKRRNKGGG